MRFDGEWYVCDDGITRPVLRGDVLAADGSWRQTPFLLDTGADCTVLDADMTRRLGLPIAAGPGRLGGLGGWTGAGSVTTEIALPRETGQQVRFQRSYAALTDPQALDMSVLGRDISDLFAIIVDRPGNLTPD